MNNYSVYLHTNKINGKKYVGITKQIPSRRWQNGYGYTGTYFGNAINKYGWNNFTHDVLITGLSKEDACGLEIALIAQFKTNNREYGYNISEGGNTCDSIIPRYGIDHPNHKRVKMIDADTGKVLAVYASHTEAAKIHGFSRKCITKACRGILKQYKGYIWEYADIDFDKPIHNGYGNYEHQKQKKPITMTDLDNNKYYFDSVKQASEVVGISTANISRYLKGIRTDRTGRRWSYGKS